MSYNRDLQEDKEPVFDAADTVRQMLEVLPPMLTAIIFRADRMRAATADGFLNATDLADYLVTKGVPFREAHEIVGRIVRQCLEAGERLESLPLTRLRQFSQAFGTDVGKHLALDACVERRQSAGGTSSRRVAEAIQAPSGRCADMSSPPQARAPWGVAVLRPVGRGSACGRKGPPLPPRPILPAAVSNLRAEPRDSAILLSWIKPSRNDDGSPLTVLLDYHVLRATGPLGETGATASAFVRLATVPAAQPISASTSGSLYAFRDDGEGKGLATEVQYRYRVQAVNRQGEVGSPSAVAVVDLIPAPPVPAGLTAAAGDGTVDLAWQASPVGDRFGVSSVKGYNIYRGVQPGAYGPQPINAAPISGTHFRDAGVGNDTTYYYIVRSLAGDRPPWRESEDSAQVSVTPQDSIAPAPPAQVASQGATGPDVDANREADTLRRGTGASCLVVSVRLTERPISGTTFTDRTVQRHATYAYGDRRTGPRAETSAPSEVRHLPDAHNPGRELLLQFS
jgi:hypothetical protein